MKMIYFIITLTIAGGLILYLTSCGNKSRQDDKSLSETVDTSVVKIRHSKKNNYEGLRNMSFTISPEKLGLSLSSDKTLVYGVIMDWEMDGYTTTTISFQTGDASMYLSSGGGVIGGGQHANVSSAAKLFVNKAQSYLDKSTKTETTPLPDRNIVKFYLLTNKGVYVGQEELNNFENKSSKWLELFEEGNKVITELRLTTESKS